MGLLDRFFGKPHPSDSWQVSAGFPLVLDLSRHSLCNVRFEDPVEYFAGLGPPENKKVLKQGCYSYPSKGLEIWADDGITKDFVVWWQTEDFMGKGCKPFQGKCLYKNKEIILSSRTTEDEFKRIFGEPYWRDVDDMEILLFYEFQGNMEWQVDFSLDGFLKTMLITNPPLMSNEDQRKVYRVTKEWPPSRFS